jgi:hypothetical protein
MKSEFIVMILQAGGVKLAQLNFERFADAMAFIEFEHVVTPCNCAEHSQDAQNHSAIVHALTMLCDIHGCMHANNFSWILVEMNDNYRTWKFNAAAHVLESWSC